jgi:hypothetical protein
MSGYRRLLALCMQVMSRCPDAQHTERVFYEVMERIHKLARLELHFIADARYAMCYIPCTGKTMSCVPEHCCNVCAQGARGHM